MFELVGHGVLLLLTEEVGMNANNAGRRVGSSLGWVAAKAVTVTIATAQGAGRFGEGVLAGAEETYVSTRLADDAKARIRAAEFQAWKAARPQSQPIGIVVG